MSGTTTNTTPMQIYVKILGGRMLTFNVTRDTMLDYSGRYQFPQEENIRFLGVLHENIVAQYKWDPHFAINAVKEYRRFLELKLVVKHLNADILSPSALIDQIWRMHVLDTRNYSKDCRSVLQTSNLQVAHPDLTFHFIHYSPDKDEEQVNRQRQHNTRLAYKVHFLQDPDPMFWGSFWRDYTMPRLRPPNALFLLDLISALFLLDLIRDRTGTAPALMRINYAGKQLELGKRLVDYNIEGGSALGVKLGESGL